MTIGQHRRLRISIVTLSLLVAGAVTADRAAAQRNFACYPSPDCVGMTLNVNLQLSKLHPAVDSVAVRCVTEEIGAFGSLQQGTQFIPVVNRAYSGSLTISTGVPRALLTASQANRTLNVTCSLLVQKGITIRSPVVSAAAGPETITDANWFHIPAGSTHTWTKQVTFPNATAAP